MSRRGRGTRASAVLAAALVLAPRALLASSAGQAERAASGTRAEADSRSEGQASRQDRVGVIPLKGSGPPPERRRATELLVRTLGGMPDLEVVALSGIGGLLGAKAEAALDACRDDPCLVRATRAVRTDRLVAGSLDAEADRWTLRLRLISTSTAALEPIARVSRGVESGPAGLIEAVVGAALDLFPEKAARSFGTLALRGGVPGASIYVDGVLAGSLATSQVSPEPRAELELRPGAHELRVVAPGRFPHVAVVEVAVGQRHEHAIELEKNRSDAPLYLAGLSLLSLGAALGVGLTIEGIASDWESACPRGMSCAPGFTRARYEDDRDTLSAGRAAVNGLLGLAGGALIAASIWFVLDPGTDAPEAAGPSGGLTW